MRVRRFFRSAFPLIIGLMLAVPGLRALVSDEGAGGAALMTTGKGFHFPRLPSDHEHMRLLVENAFGYTDPAHGIVEPASGYPAEGWNQQPETGLFLRSFTQLTAIGAWIELLANIAAGYAENPYLSRDAALDGLTRALDSLRADQANPALARKGLLVNFLGLEGAERTGPLAETVERGAFIESFGDPEGTGIWQALVEKGWLVEQDHGRRGKILRREGYGLAHFNGALEPYSDEALRRRIMELLDQRAITIIFGDNANLTAALARSAGAMLDPQIRDDPRAIALRSAIDDFIDRQQEGYAHLLDAKSGTFFFGWEATTDRFVGWDDGQGNWVTGQMNYAINEFRGPGMFVVLRYGLPLAAIRNAGFKIKPYQPEAGRDVYALAAWEGSAFQLLGLSLFMDELRNPAWRRLLGDLVDIELDFSNRRGLPGLLSEAYSGKGAEYTGLIGIPELAVTDKPLNTEAPSLYSLGVAYTIAPDKVERFLQRHWALIAQLFTDHGPWEGWDRGTQRVIPYQTTAHTLSLILGGINSAPDNMRRYLAHRGLADRLEPLYPPGDRANLLAPEVQMTPWTANGTPIELVCLPGGCRLQAELNAVGGVRFALPGGGLSLSNGRLVLNYRSATGLEDVRIAFDRVEGDPLPPPAIPVEVFLRMAPSEAGEIEVVLPATPALTGIGAVSLSVLPSGRGTAVDLWITGFDFIPYPLVVDPPR